LARRNIKLGEVVAAIAEIMGLEFIQGKTGDWQAVEVPHFINFGTAREALWQVGLASGLADWVCQATARGKIYCGANPHGEVSLPPELFRQMTVAGADTAWLPGLRPGVRIRIGETAARKIKKISTSGENMRLEY
jgi:hypothetical protein